MEIGTIVWGVKNIEKAVGFWSCALIQVGIHG